MRQDALTIVEKSIQAVLPDEAVKKALTGKTFGGRIRLVSIGKAAWNMANAAHDILGDAIEQGVVITKYQHAKGAIGTFEIIEGGHPLLDENSILGTEKALAMLEGLTEKDTVLFLISGGGSALFEKPLEGVSVSDIHSITEQLLKKGADIVEINTIRKHLSAVKGGRFAHLCKPANVFAVVLSDVLGDRLDSIASGPVAADRSTAQEALAIVEKYALSLSLSARKALSQETPKAVTNVEAIVTGSVRELCNAAAVQSKELGYTPLILNTTLDCEAKEAGKFLASMARTIAQEHLPIAPPCAIICGGETVVRITGTGKGGRNQELAFSAAEGIEGLKNVVVVGVGSDGTDGPTDAAGGICDGNTAKKLSEKGVSISSVLYENNSYEALKEVDGLIMTGATGTNVNDLYFLLCKE